MGQKVHPIGLRLGINKDWDSKWFSTRDYASQLHEDIKIRAFMKKKLKLAGVSRIRIERTGKFIRIEISTARPGRVIGERGQGIETVKTELQALTDKQIYINIIEVKSPETDAQLVADNISFQIEKQISFRRAMKKAINSAMQGGALGIKVAISGRLGGAEIARREWMKEGRIPLHTLRADIDYGFAEAFTTYGQIGIKVWVFKKEIMKEIKRPPKKEVKEIKENTETNNNTTTNTETGAQNANAQESQVS
ncbi:MAG: 30S ribosomal protein S3 [bacterium]|nr:30S ribosomal protein S3 [bacterium]MDD5354640.1 30S ribosomal protein S3 [bacterium]MDD5756475.1 30S ribosomal protein S3 [bacterium]